MRFSWTSIIFTAPWTGTGDWISWRATVLAFGKFGLSECTGDGSTWWNRLEGTTPFKVVRVVTYGNSLSCTIYNVIVEAFMFHWVVVLSEKEL